MESGPFIVDLPMNIVIFHSHVKLPRLPEGIMEHPIKIDDLAVLPFQETSIIWTNVRVFALDFALHLKFSGCGINLLELHHRNEWVT